MLKPKTMDEYLDLVHEAVYELDEMRVAVDDADPEDEWERYRPLLDRLDAGVRQLYEDMSGGRYRFQPGTDLPFMPLVGHLGDEVPLKSLLKIINGVHRNGL